MDGWSLALWVSAVLVAIDFVVRVVALIVIPRNRRPQTAMAWLLAIFFLPYIFNSNSMRWVNRPTYQQVTSFGG